MKKDKIPESCYECTTKDIRNNMSYYYKDMTFKCMYARIHKGIELDVTKNEFAKTLNSKCPKVIDFKKK
jgi:hypothetical protein